MPLEHLLAALEREATARAESVLAAAQAEADRVRQDGDALVARRRAEALRAREADLRGAVEAALGDARRASQLAVLEARARFLDRVFERARALFPSAVASAAYRAALPGHVAEALTALGDEPAVIRCPEPLVSAVRAAVDTAAQVRIQGDPAAPAGLTAVSTDGAIEVDNTLAGRLDRLRPALALEVLARVPAP
ncbi:MAG TPA: V-type ATP synthase subunit E family protein [Gemmatimonadales bacterium]|nr:V-type ATP synthase subunit E family protein [Gemmatimonadales bacterium]